MNFNNAAPIDLGEAVEKLKDKCPGVVFITISIILFPDNLGKTLGHAHQFACIYIIITTSRG